MSEGNQREKGTKPIPLARCQTPWTLPERDNNTNWLIVFSRKPFPFILLPNCSHCCVWAAQLNSVLLLLGISAWSIWESQQPWKSTAAGGWLCEQGLLTSNYEWSKGVSQPRLQVRLRQGWHPRSTGWAWGTGQNSSFPSSKLPWSCCCCFRMPKPSAHHLLPESQQINQQNVWWRDADWTPSHLWRLRIYFYSLRCDFTSRALQESTIIL